MGEDSSRIYADELMRMNSQMNQLLAGQVRVETVVETQGVKIDRLDEKIDKLDNKVDQQIGGIKDKIAEMPSQWQRDAEGLIESCRERRDEVTGAIDVALEREKARKHTSSTSIKPPPRQDSFLKEMFAGSGKYIFLSIIVFAMSLGGVLFTKCSKDGEIQQREDLLKEVNDLLQKSKDDHHAAHVE